jgi:hypothetical protein
MVKKIQRIAFQLEDFLFCFRYIVEDVLDNVTISHADLDWCFATGAALLLDLTASVYIHPLVHSFHFNAMPTIRQENEPTCVKTFVETFSFKDEPR